MVLRPSDLGIPMLNRYPYVETTPPENDKKQIKNNFRLYKATHGES